MLHAPGSEVPRDRLREPVSATIRSEPVICAPATPIREVARRMTQAGATALIVDLGDSVGIVADSDLALIEIPVRSAEPRSMFDSLAGSRLLSGRTL